MTFYVETECKETFPFSAQEAGARAAAQVLAQEGCPFPCDVNLLLTNDAEIRALNRQHRGIDEATDVLSFPALPFEAPAAFPGRDDPALSFADPDTGNVWLGDIVISVERALAQAEAYGHSPLREFSFLVVHSMLHLLGYDHMTEEEARVMEEHAERALNALQITRDGDT